MHTETMIEHDEWFYDSITRYKTLNMFELEHPVHHVEPCDTNSICVSSTNNKRHQIIEFSLPVKLALQADSDESMITNDTDLKIKCGTFTHAKVAHMKTTCSGRKVVASHYNTEGIALYQLSSDGSDEIKMEAVMKCELESPSIALDNTDVVLAKNRTSPKLLLDIDIGQVIGKLPSYELSGTCEELVSPVFIESKLVALCHQTSGHVQLYDSRSLKLLNTFNTFPDTTSNSLWSFSSLYECSDKPARSIHSAHLAIVSNSGLLHVYDSRNWNTPCISDSLNLKPTNISSLHLRFKPSNKSWISVGGFDGNVYVYEIVSKPELVFVHDGHRHVEGFTSETITLSHVWFPTIDNLIISSADNASVQLWQFEGRKT